MSGMQISRSHQRDTLIPPHIVVGVVPCFFFFFSQPLNVTSVTMWKAKLQITSNHRMGQYVREFQRHAAEGKVPRSFLVPLKPTRGSRSDKVCYANGPVFSGAVLQSVRYQWQPLETSTILYSL